MNKIRIIVTLAAIVSYLCIAYFYGWAPATIALGIWVLGQIDGREEYRDEYKRMET